MRAALVTAMRDEGPYLLEWVAYHRLIGFTDILIYTNECTDGTDALAEALAARGLIRHMPNPVPPDTRPHREALARGLAEVAGADWAMALDADEFLNISVGGGGLSDLIGAAPGADLLLLNWRHLGDPEAARWAPGLVTERFLCASRPRDPVNSAVKTLFARP
ncbi:MAG: glycosyltransferase family 2 protein, partial [Pseudomonadota bacterium]